MQKYMHLLFTSLNFLDKTLLRVLLNSINLFFFLHFASMQQAIASRCCPSPFLVPTLPSLMQNDST
jgi:hypothetical protein